MQTKKIRLNYFFFNLHVLNIVTYLTGKLDTQVSQTLLLRLY